MSETSEAVDSIISYEDALKKENDALLKELRYRAVCMRDMAKILADCGSDDHRTKNEVLLRVIGMLLLYSDTTTRFTKNLHDEIPF